MVVLRGEGSAVVVVIADDAFLLGLVATVEEEREKPGEEELCFF